MDRFDLPLTQELGDMDPQGGVLVVTSYWRPRLSDPNPEQPGEKLTLVSYLPTKARALCPCGSSKRFGECCQPLPYWRPVCPNPGMQGYELVVPQSARWRQIPGLDLQARFAEDARLYEVQTTWQGGFWIYWGDPAYDAPYGTLCFGDIELKRRHSLLVTALSEQRMTTLLDLLSPLQLGPPQRQRDPAPPVPKPPRHGSRRTPRRKAEGERAGLQREQDDGNEDHRQVVDRPFFVAGSHATEVF